MSTSPTPEQLAEWRKEFESGFPSIAKLERGAITGRYLDIYIDYCWQGYLRAKTEQAAEIAQLKAQLAEVMPLAKFGAKVTNAYVGGICFARADDLNSKAFDAGVIQYDHKYAPNIEATINKLLKD